MNIKEYALDKIVNREAKNTLDIINEKIDKRLNLLNTSFQSNSIFSIASIKENKNKYQVLLDLKLKLHNEAYDFVLNKNELTELGINI